MEYKFIRMHEKHNVIVVSTKHDNSLIGTIFNKEMTMNPHCRIPLEVLKEIVALMESL